MKKVLLLLAAALLSCPVLKAQDDDAVAKERREAALDRMVDDYEKTQQESALNRIWGKGRYTRLGYAIAETGEDGGYIEKGLYAFFLQKGTTYRLHRPKALFNNMVRIGLDAVWADIQFASYKGLEENGTSWTSSIEETPGWEDDGEEFDLNLGTMGLSLAMGIGPNVSVAPFVNMAKGLQPLRASLYFHYSPTMMMYMKSIDGELELSTGFCNMFDFGGALHYRGIALGVEGRWGQGKFKPFDFESMFDEEAAGGTGLADEKYTRRFANTRIYLQFTF